MRVVPYLLGPGVRRFSSALLYDPPLEIDVPAWSDEQGPQAFIAVVEAAKRAQSSVSSALVIGEKYLWMQQQHSQRLMQEIGALRPYVRLVSSLYPGTRRVFQDVRAIYKAKRELVLQLTNTAPAAGTAAFDFYRRVYEYWLEAGKIEGEVIGFLEKEAEELQHPHDLLIESYVNRFLCTFGSFVTSLGSSADTPTRHDFIHSVVDSVGAAELAAACIEQRSVSQADLSSAHEVVLERAREVVAAPVALILFDRIVSGHVPLIANRKAAEQLAAMLADHAEALKALRRRCRLVADELIQEASSEAEFKERFETSLQALTDEASEIRRSNREATRKYIQTLSEDAVLWALTASLAGAVAGVMPAIGTLPSIIGLFARLGAQAVKVRRERNEKISASDLRFLYFVDPEGKFA